MRVRALWVVLTLALLLALPMPRIGAQSAQFDQFLHQPNTFSSTQTFNNITVNGTCSGCGAGSAITSLTGPVTASGPGAAATTIGANAVLNANINSLAWSKLTSTPTTFSGYGISDSVTNLMTAISSGTSGTGNFCLVTNCTLVTPILGTPQSVNLSNATALPWTSVTSTPTTLGTYGITNAKTSLGFTVDGAGSVITTGTKGFLYVPNACTISASTLLSTDAAVTSGSIVIDVWKVAFASYPPTVTNTITASDLPTLSSATNAQDTTLTGWTKSVSAGDVLAFHVNSATTVTRVTLILSCNPT